MVVRAQRRINTQGKEGSREGESYKQGEEKEDDDDNSKQQTTRKASRRTTKSPRSSAVAWRVDWGEILTGQ
jgi:hypothetical protein